MSQCRCGRLSKASSSTKRIRREGDTGVAVASWSGGCLEASCMSQGRSLASAVNALRTAPTPPDCRASPRASRQAFTSPVSALVDSIGAGLPANNSWSARVTWASCSCDSGRLMIVSFLCDRGACCKRTGYHARRRCVHFDEPVLMGSCSICAAREVWHGQELVCSEFEDRRAQSGRSGTLRMNVWSLRIRWLTACGTNRTHAGRGFRWLHRGYHLLP